MRLGLGLGLAQKQLRGFVPSILFSGGEKGVWYDPSDLSTLFQDAAGTTPVTAAGQPVGKILDKSGRGAHATQSTATSRPILGLESGRYYLTFDGVDDWLSTAAIDFTGTDKMTVVVGARKLSDAATGILCEFSATTSTNTGSFNIAAPNGTNEFSCLSKGSVGGSGALFDSALYAAPVSAILSMSGSISTDTCALRVNAASAATSSADQGTGNYGNYVLYIGRRGGTTLPFNGRLYGLIVRGAQSSDAQIAASETYLNSKTGAY